MRLKYTEAEVDEIEFETIYNFSENLMKAKFPKKNKQAKSNREKGYKPKENTFQEDIYGIIFLAYGFNIYLEASMVSEDDFKSEEV